MKRLLALLLALAMVLALAACAEEKPPATSPNATEGTTAPTEPKEGVFKRDSYSVSNELAKAQRETVVATVGDNQLTNGLLQIYYWMGVCNFIEENYNYLVYYGLDYTQHLDEQSFMDQDGTWQHFFLEDALGKWHNYQAVALEAEKQGIKPDAATQEAIDSIRPEMEKSREELGYATLDEMVQADAGPGCLAEDYVAYRELFFRSYSYYDHLLSTTTFTDEEVEEWFKENEEGLASRGVTKDTVGYDVRHILVKVGEEKTDADWEKCKNDAQALLDQWLAGEATEDSFAAMAKEHSEDGGSSANGGLYEDLTKDTSFVEPFKNWYLDESRAVGDYGLVKSDYGYHIMYFSGSGTIWMDYCRSAMTDNAVNEQINKIVESYPLTIDYDKISLGIVNLAD